MKIRQANKILNKYIEKSSHYRYDILLNVVKRLEKRNNKMNKNNTGVYNND